MGRLMARGRPPLRCAATFALVAIGVVACPLRSWAGGAVTFQTADQGYQITKTDAGQNAPSGYEGRTDNATQRHQLQVT